MYWAKGVSKEQYKLFTDLLLFLEENEIPVSYFAKAKSKQEIKSAINAMYTVVKKHGLSEELQKRKSDEKGE